MTDHKEPVEIEAKFAMNEPTQVEWLRTASKLSALYSLGDPMVSHYQDAYLDTPAYDLLRHGYSLRMRQVTGEADQVTLTIKSLASGDNALFQERLEIEKQISLTRAEGSFQEWPAPIRTLLNTVMEEEAVLRPLCVIQQQRHKRLVTTSDKQHKGQAVEIGELSLDEVIVYLPGASLDQKILPMELVGTALTTFQEVEIELAPGQDPAILETVAKAVLRRRGVCIVRGSKFERALEIISEQLFDGVGYVAKIQPTLSVAEVCRSILYRQFTQVLLNEAGVRGDIDMEHVHQMRVALRRARVAIRLLGDNLAPKRLRRYAKRLRKTAQLLGAVRDLDVALHHLKKEVIEGVLPEAASSQLAEQWHAQRRQMYEVLINWLDSAKYQQFVADFMRFCQTPGKGVQSFPLDPYKAPPCYQVRHIMPNLILDAFTNVRRFELLLAAQEAIPAETLHLLRIECKYLRYCLEFNRDWLGTPGHNLIQALKQLQEHLGELNDASVRYAMLEPLTRGEEAEALVSYSHQQGEIVHKLRADLAGHLQEFLAPANRQRLALTIMGI